MSAEFENVCDSIYHRRNRNEPSYAPLLLLPSRIGLSIAVTAQ
jgi:hypothetical protein